MMTRKSESFARAFQERFESFKVKYEDKEHKKRKAEPRA